MHASLPRRRAPLASLPAALLTGLAATLYAIGPALAARADEAGPPPAMPTPSASGASAASLGAVAASLRYDSRLAAFKTPFGAQPAKSWIEFQLTALPGVEKLELVVERRRVEGNEDLIAYAEEARVPLHKAGTAEGRERWKARHRFGAPGVYGYYFIATIDGARYVVQNNADTIHWTKEKGSMGPASIAPLREGPDAKGPLSIRRYRQTIHASDFAVPGFARDLIYYYVFPERFRNGDSSNDPQVGKARYQDHGIERHPRWLDRPYKPGSGDGSDAVYNNDFFGGDLAGLIDKLDDLRELGVNALYLTPVFQAASNHKYDTGDYKRIDPAFGSNDDFQRLTSEAGKRGLRVIPDTSLNHVGADSPYFNRFGNFPPGGAFDNGKANPTSPYASWFRFDLSRPKPDDQYAAWIGIKDLPELDKSSRAFRDYAFGRDGVMQFWLDRGAAGWRMDVAPWVPDDFWRAWRIAVKRHQPEALTIAETWFDASKFFLGDTFDATMNYIFRNAVLDFAAGVSECGARLPEPGAAAGVLSAAGAVRVHDAAVLARPAARAASLRRARRQPAGEGRRRQATPAAGDVLPDELPGRADDLLRRRGGPGRRRGPVQPRALPLGRRRRAAGPGAARAGQAAGRPAAVAAGTAARQPVRAAVAGRARDRAAAPGWPPQRDRGDEQRHRADAGDHRAAAGAARHALHRRADARRADEGGGQRPVADRDRPAERAGAGGRLSPAGDRVQARCAARWRARKGRSI